MLWSKKTTSTNLYLIMNETQHLLDTQIKELDLSDSFKNMAEAQDFRTLQDILNWPVSVLLMHDGFTYHHYQELWNYLQKNKLLVRLKK